MNNKEVIRMINMNDLRNTQPFEGSESEYKSIEDVLGRDIKIIDLKFFENDKGEGVFILCMDLDEEELFHLCTHSISLVSTLKNPKIKEVLDTGDAIATKIIRRKSTKSDRMVYAFA